MGTATFDFIKKHFPGKTEGQEQKRTNAEMMDVKSRRKNVEDCSCFNTSSRLPCMHVLTSSVQEHELN